MKSKNLFLTILMLLILTSAFSQEKTKKELELLDKLYSLYTAVVQTISGYSDVLWTDAQANMEAMTEQVNGFQANCKKLPKSLRDWDSCKELTKRIDDFLLVLPLLQQLAGKSMRQRHWDEKRRVLDEECSR